MDPGALRLMPTQLDQVLGAIAEVKADVREFKREILSRLDDQERAHAQRFERIEGRVTSIEQARRDEATVAKERDRAATGKDSSVGKWFQRIGIAAAAIASTVAAMKGLGLL